MLTACAWRHSPAGAAPLVAGLRQFLSGWPSISRLGPSEHTFSEPLQHGS
jgi:hypothetical protein